ncbi:MULTISPECIES: serine hydrolase [Paenibacillus]|uniref:serine hydrolase n=1 Tax=Paenibacillus TaxID=44249 RepID=UPI002FE12E97
MVVFVLIVVFIVLALLLFMGLGRYIKKKDDQKTEQDVLKFIANHPERVSIHVIENGEHTVSYGSDHKRPLASVVKLVIAAEFAEQAAEGKIIAEERVPLRNLERFYIPGTDGNAHPGWLKSLGSLSPDEPTVPLLEVARGMIRFSSNANTEFLLEKLGLDRVNRRIGLLGLKEHDPIYPISSSMLVYSYLMETRELSHRQVLEAMKRLPYEEMSELAKDIFTRISQDSAWIPRLSRTRSPLAAQRIWSAKLPGSTAREYANLLCRIRRGELLSPQATGILLDLLDRPQSPDSPFKTLGGKGGSTLTILNQALYCEDALGNQAQLAVFIHDPDGMELLWLNHKLDLFLREYLTNRSFKDEVNRTLK